MNETRDNFLTETCELLERSKNVLEQHIGLWNTSGKFIVIMPSGIPIRCQSPRKTFNQVIKMLGVEDVYNLGIRTPNRPLISNEPGSNDIEIAPGRYIQAAFSNWHKAEILLQIAERLDIELFIIDIDTRNDLISAWRTSNDTKIHTIPQQPSS
jgi:hypothetical protein